MLATAFAALLVERWEVTDHGDLAFRLAVITELADGLLKRSFQDDPDGDPRFIAATKEIVRDYLLRHVH